ncbi:polyprenyl diphosphate synthase [Litorivicinus lipolyticus]|nr:polyprenyl diphosphate synthase [Litorivicinus lipolyticus]
MSLPRHVAIIMDGNNRWAQREGHSGLGGHKAGGESVKVVTDRCLHHGIAHLTLFAFSSENWNRPAVEVKGLMELFATTLKKDIKRLNERQVRLRVIGRRDRLSARLVRLIEAAEVATADNRAMTVNLAVDYGGRWDISQAAAAWALDHAGQPDCPESELEPYLSLAHSGPVDLLIRTGGDHRVSNFTLWQAAYAELSFCDTLWPDFGDAAFDGCLDDFAGRERRFGGRKEKT